MVFDHNAVDEILNAIFPLPSKFGMIYYQDSYEDEDTYPISAFEIEDMIHDVDPDAEIYYGASKLVILPSKSENIVIKIPFNGYFYTNSDNDEAPYWRRFACAHASDTSDYCLAEYEKFKALKILHLDCFVAKTILYKTYYDVRVFIQERVISDDESYDDHPTSKKSQDLAQKIRKEQRIYLDVDWMANCLDKYHQSKVEKFLNYCKNKDYDIIADMHMRNYGYRKNGTPVILDYANYLD